MILAFLKNLKKNNSREWFQDNKKSYEEAKHSFVFITAKLISEISKFDSTVKDIDPESAVFRIYKDVRFSKDKSPYKTNFGAYVAKGGRKASFPGYYIHIEPNESMAAGGIYMPPPEVLLKLRNFMSENYKEAEKIMKSKKFSEVFPSMYDDRLKTVPKGFSKEHPAAELLKYKSFIFSSMIDDDSVNSEKFTDEVLKKFKIVYEWNRFLQKAV